jgi:hypothetical protein
MPKNINKKSKDSQIEEYTLSGEQKELIKSKYARFRTGIAP